MASMRFTNRARAGEMLAEQLMQYAHRSDVIVIALPRGGVPVAASLAQRLGVALDIVLVRKLGVPGHEEYAMGAIASGGLRWLNAEVIRALGVEQAAVESVARSEGGELDRRALLYRGAAAPPAVRGRVAILVDDGLATGASMRVAARAIRAMQPQYLIVAVPVGARESCDDLREEVDEVLCLHTPVGFRSVGQWYDDFSQTSDSEVIALLRDARARDPGRPGSGAQ